MLPRLWASSPWFQIAFVVAADLEVIVEGVLSLKSEFRTTACFVTKITRSVAVGKSRTRDSANVFLATNLPVIASKESRHAGVTSCPWFAVGGTPTVTATIRPSPVNTAIRVDR